MSWTKLHFEKDGTLRFEGDNLGITIWCMYTDVEACCKWIQNHNIVSYYNSNCFHHTDVPYLLKKHRKFAGYEIPNPGEERISEIADEFDHGRVYKSKEQCYLVAHIYNDTPELRRNLAQWCEENGLYLKFLEYSWYSPGSTTAYVISDKEIS